MLWTLLTAASRSGTALIAGGAVLGLALYGARGMLADILPPAQRALAPGTALVLLCASSGPLGAQEVDPAVLLRAHCRLQAPQGCVCASSVEDPLPLAEMIFLIRFYEQEGTWISRAQAWLGPSLAGSMIAGLRAECRDEAFLRPQAARAPMAGLFPAR